jgi:hypothetical protein
MGHEMNDTDHMMHRSDKMTIQLPVDFDPVANKLALTKH